jgi:hypothetical protein
MQGNEGVEAASLVTNRPCKHTGLRSFTFRDGQTIECCPSCPHFDKHRREVLCPTRGGVRG